MIFDKRMSYPGIPQNLSRVSNHKMFIRKEEIMQKTKKLFIFCIAVVIAISMSGPVMADNVEKIDLNKASVAELVQLKKVGPKYAQRIVDFREKNGPFKKPEDIMQVQGIGYKTFELNKDRIVIEQ
jgi:competence protein ComEA